MVYVMYLYMLCTDGICIQGVYTCDVCVYISYVCVWCNMCDICVLCIYVVYVCECLWYMCIWYMFKYAHICVCVVYVSAHRCTCEWRSKVNVRYLLNCSPLYFRRQGFSVNLEFIDRLAWPCRELHRSPVSVSLGLGLQAWPLCLAFMKMLGLNSGCHAHVANTLPTESPRQCL